MFLNQGLWDSLVTEAVEVSTVCLDRGVQSFRNLIRSSKISFFRKHAVDDLIRFLCGLPEATGTPGNPELAKPLCTLLELP